MNKPCHGEHWFTACTFVTNAETLKFPGKKKKKWKAGDWSAVCIRRHVVRGHEEGTRDE